jgi:hypothetical protein
MCAITGLELCRRRASAGLRGRHSLFAVASWPRAAV